MLAKGLFAAKPGAGIMGRDLYVCTAGDLATRSIASQSPDATVAATTDWLESEGYDVAPVIDGETVVGYVELDHLQDAAADDKIAAHTNPVTLEEIISTDATFDEVLSALYESPFYFLGGRNRLTGILTRADLNTSPALIHLFDRITLLEERFRELILDEAPDWKERLSLDPNIVEDIEERHADARQSNIELLGRDNAFTYEGRPVVNIWNASAIPWDDGYHSRIMEEWGSYAEFTAEIREHLRIDGTDPFIIGGVTSDATDGFENRKPRVPRFLRELDGTTTWVGGSAWGEDNQATWEDVIPYVEENYEGHRSFVDNHDMEFIPMVFPGFDDRMNTCWGQDRLTPRSQEHFVDLLELADEYRTTDMIDIATWNDWTEGSQIEPGTFRGTDYGTEYLDIVKDFQKAK